MAFYDAVSTVTTSYLSDSNSPMVTKKRGHNAQLYEICDVPNLLKLREIFRVHQGKITANEFRQILRNQLNAEYDDEEYRLLFMKINTARNDEVDWHEFISHLKLGHFSNDLDNQRGATQLPILGYPNIYNSRHRNPIARIRFSPYIRKDRTVDPIQGNYVTVSRDGMVNWWTLSLKYLRSGISCSSHLKIHSTWVTDMVCMPDISIIATSSTERELRFYDCTAGNFTLKIVISSWKHMICTMHYHFFTDVNEKSLLICGDVGGNIMILTFSPKDRGPFRNEAGSPVTYLQHMDLIKHPNRLPELRLLEYLHVHKEWVRQVSYYPSLFCVVSCATSPDSMLMRDIEQSKTCHMFSVEKGIQCFEFDEETHTIVTGGPDCTVRVWNSFVPKKPNVVLHGHHAGIIDIVIQDHGRKIYSLDRNRTIKVWDTQSVTCLQTYIDIPREVGEIAPLSAQYNKATHEYIVGAIKLAVVTLDEQLNCEHTDGFTHTRAVSKVLYNPLFKIVITCGMDSYIICWNLKTGKCTSVIPNAHHHKLHGELVPVEITAACFNPGQQFLLTGARNGTLKVWNFNNGLCMRNMTIEYMSEVTNVFWTTGRILAMGWNRHVIEFEDHGTATTGKPWELRHTHDILAAAVRAPYTIVTTTYNSEMIMWKMETGQPFRKFSCTEPMQRIKLSNIKKDVHRTNLPYPSEKPVRSSFAYRKSSSQDRRHSSISDPRSAAAKNPTHRHSSIQLPGSVVEMRKQAVHAALFLETRPADINIASLFVAVENGKIQCWSDHPAGGFKGSFMGVHTSGDYVSAMATDLNNDYLFTGTTIGYIKVWLMTNYMKNEKIHVNMPKLLMEFPFLWKDRIEGRAKRYVRYQPLPLLLNSYRAHLRSIRSIVYVDETKLVLSASFDYSVRVWRLSGEYLQTLGSSVPWSLSETRFPPDVRKIASSTTLKVWRHGEVSRYTPGQILPDTMSHITEHDLKTKIYGKVPKRPILGQYFKLPRKPDIQDAVQLDTTLRTIPIYNHLRLATTQTIKRPATPELVQITRLKRNSME